MSKSSRKSSRNTPSKPPRKGESAGKKPSKRPPPEPRDPALVGWTAVTMAAGGCEAMWLFVRLFLAGGPVVEGQLPPWRVLSGSLSLAAVFLGFVCLLTTAYVYVRSGPRPPWPIGLMALVVSLAPVLMAAVNYFSG